MAKLTDLPADLVHKIIAHLIDHRPQTEKAHYNLDHDEIGPNPAKRTRPHLELKETCRRHCHSFVAGAQIPQYPLEVSWQEGLPTNPLLPLTLVNHTFRQCAQQALFKNVALGTQWQAYLFLRALTCTTTHDESTLSATGRVPSTVTDHPLKVLALHVRSLQFNWRGPASMGKGGGSLICDIIRTCPVLENLAISTTLLRPCKEPLLEALAGRQFLREFVVLRNPYYYGDLHLQWQVDEVLARLCSGWKHLETIELHKLAGHEPHKSLPSNPINSIPTMNCALKTLILERCDLNDREISWILESSRESMRTLKIIEPTQKLSRPGLCRILKDCTSPNLEILKISISTEWHVIYPSEYVEGSDDPATNRGLLDVVFKTSSALRKLKSLSIDGSLIGVELFTLLPPSIVKFDWGDHEMDGSAFARALSNSDSTAQCLPNLECFSIRNFSDWAEQDRHVIRTTLMARGVCFHTTGGKDFCKDEEAYYRGGSDGSENLSGSADSLSSAMSPITDPRTRPGERYPEPSEWGSDYSYVSSTASWFF
ncbi:hypothetical protein PtA15_9A196 [Puccinia triticina]|uniref:F-box domain-containing protein n=1 Tax=Puccinia triticina TaxID=208348 RepID=A0ABY7CS47_9BASI|nr:uncharacterized protein PtA15_9A196 [Puccinia triticina]WAQ88071.1 hypothetical protein PtA15_9A196 [Puccinia triticina]